jgi:hypothetical protein
MHRRLGDTRNSERPAPTSAFTEASKKRHNHAASNTLFIMPKVGVFFCTSLLFVLIIGQALDSRTCASGVGVKQREEETRL